MIKMKGIRINRYIALCGLSSRREAEKLILSGRVKINGRTIKKLTIRINPESDKVEVDGEIIEIQREKIYLMLNKPFGYICSRKDPMGRPTIYELLNGRYRNLFSIGRLDFDSLGLLLLTNDGKLCYSLTHPRFAIPRTYKVVINKTIKDSAIERLKRGGIILKDGESPPVKISLLEIKRKRSILRITIRSGRNRIVRRIFEALGYRVIHLIRIGFGPIQLGDLKVGQYRRLTPKEIGMLKVSIRS